MKLFEYIDFMQCSLMTFFYTDSYALSAALALLQ